MTREIAMTFRSCSILILAVATAVLSACGTFSRREPEFQSSRSMEPLQVPDGLDSPRIDDAMRIPEPAVGRDIRGTAVASAPPPGRASLVGDRLVLADHPQSAWRRVNLALERMAGEVEVLGSDEAAGRIQVAVTGTRPVQGLLQRLVRRERRVREEIELQMQPTAQGTEIRTVGDSVLARGLLQQLQERLG
jgi:uncharacterized lipoprotein